MKLKTETILTVSKFLAGLGFIWGAILWGGHLLTLVSSFINPEWSKHTYQPDMSLSNIQEHSTSFFVYGMCLLIVATGLKAAVWYVVFDLLLKLKLQTPFSMTVERKLEWIAYLLFGVWVVSSIFWKMYIYYLNRDTGIQLAPNPTGDEYLFMAGMIYIISQVFKRGIEIQEENDLTV